MALVIDIAPKGRGKMSSETDEMESEDMAPKASEEMAAAGDELIAAIKAGDGAAVALAVCNIYALHEEQESLPRRSLTPCPLRCCEATS
jgi:hypothetical protein